MIWNILICLNNNFGNFSKVIKSEVLCDFEHCMLVKFWVMLFDQLEAPVENVVEQVDLRFICHVKHK